MDPKYKVYDDAVISVGLFAEDDGADKQHLLHLGIRWNRPKPCTGKNGTALAITNVMGGETGWFLLPHSYGVAVGRTLIEQRVADCGLAQYFNEKAFKRMVAWLTEMEELNDGMCY